MPIVGTLFGRLLRGIIAALPLAISVPADATAEPAPALGAYNADIAESSISGISSGAFMAVQFATAWSSTTRGIGVVAGGPYYCAEGTATSALTGQNILRATGPCMKGAPDAPSIAPLIAATEAWVRSKDIDEIKHLKGQKIYLFNGYNDAVVARSVTDAAVAFYRHFLGAAQAGNLYYQYGVGAGHSQVTIDWGQPCAKNEGDYIDACGYDQAGIILQFIYGTLAAKNTDHPTGRLEPFDQRDFTRPTLPVSYSMAETGYVYVPAACERQERCRVHIALHGCEQYAGRIGDDYTAHAGYNEWADTNRIIVLYPQTIANEIGAPFNPHGCWDWWGYTNFNYAVKAGRQIATLKAMLDRLTSGVKPLPTASPGERTPTGLATIDSSDTAIALAWAPIAGAAGYKVYRSVDPAQPFELRGAVAGPSFGDAGLTPATRYSYKVTAVVDGVESPASAIVTQATRRVPPRCAEPGTCRVEGR
jgi:hypothetical protein